ncbi:MarR family transcriptional regulator [Starkeya koreensis]|uniref:MarR family transcriptional regulator n=1 Tax=Ancylobacter koreensis TaxID=266121 RepID=A0ABT0DRY7_9HYPH|nr:helix-turn-helix domain-containing protein [Ancylobacter koreensis]MCK0210046.1 MarR family transcriptional regulator [Ancylobacter koreensis]
MAASEIRAASGRHIYGYEVLMPAEVEERRRLRARPDFPWIARQAAIHLATAYRGNFLLTRVLNDRGRLTLALLMLQMHFEPAGAPGLTVGRLKAEAVALDICSPGRVGAILAAFRLLGLLAPAPDADRRRRRLIVTGRLLDVHRERWRVMLKTLSLVMPEGEAGLARLDDDAFLGPFVDALLEPLRRGWRPVYDIPELALFVDRDGGLMIAFGLFGTAPTGAPATVAGLARAYRVSRSHVVDIVQKATEAGLVRRLDPQADGRSGVVAEPALIDAMERLIATALARQASAVRHALKAVGG